MRSTLFLLCAGLIFAQTPDLPGTPFAVIDGPTMARPGQSVRFSSTKSFDFDGEIVSTSFSVDGERVDARTIVRNFLTGSHQIELTVTDDSGLTATVRQTLVVARPLDHLLRKFRNRERRGAVMLLCERGNAQRARAIEEVGAAIFRPIMEAAYADVELVYGPRANPEGLFEAIRSMAARREAVDVFLYAHGSRGKLWFKGKTSVTGDDIVAALQNRGGEKIRMVYSTLCWGETMNEAWRKVGARAASGTVDVHIPVEAPIFLLGWLSGREYASLMAQSFHINWDFHRFRNENVTALRPILKQIHDNLGDGSVELTLRYYLEWFMKDSDWEIWKSLPVIDGSGVTIDTFPREGFLGDAGASGARLKELPVIELKRIEAPGGWGGQPPRSTPIHLGSARGDYEA